MTAAQETIGKVKDTLRNLAAFTIILAAYGVCGTIFLQPEENAPLSLTPTPGRVTPTNTPARSASDKEADKAIAAALAETRIQTPAPLCNCQCWSDYGSKWFPCGEGSRFTCLPKPDDACSGHWVKSTPVPKAR